MPERRLRIAVFSDSALPVLNGVSISVDTMIRQLRDRGHSVHLYTASSKGCKDSDPNTYRFRAIEVPWTKGYSLAVPPFYWMLKKFRANEYDLIHTHTPFTIGFVGLRWAESHEVPIVATYHTLYDRYAHYIPLFPRRYVRFKLAKHTSFYYNRVRHVIVPSQAAQKWLQRHSVTSPITVIPTASAQRRMIDRSEIRQRLGIAPDHKVLLYVGRIAKEKNLPTLLQMARLVMRQDPIVRLVLVGDGPYREECMRLARDLAVGDRVRFEGFVPRDKVDEYYAASDLFVFSSITETQGLVVQEAMAYGLPAVAVTGGGASECIESGVNGIVVRNDPVEFADAVLEVLADERAHSELSANAAKAARTTSATEMADRILEVYRGVLSIPAKVAPSGQGIVR
ncbi:MAG: glycosyl transferase [Chthonomonadaceae bacterium]|uniref:Glycosyltransferase family 4 protein n=1 Tax=Candidatus Nitrosymbiomonas proteolyticus TaxID=2608984 RepID=A0A809S842_9BACT|nr:glycosyltransferase family 4 protein [Candidatus Nitrosymbiomonas proteolyticus]HQU17893.1 glycosyltransferase [Fimbriimonadaceae bacterium]